MLRLFSSGLCAAVVLMAPAAATAHDVTQGLRQTAQPSTEWSAATTKKKRKRAVTVYPGQPYAYYPPARSYGWRPADPSFDQDGRPYRNPFPGQCMVDLGYGRWESCNQVR